MEGTVSCGSCGSDSVDPLAPLVEFRLETRRRAIVSRSPCALSRRSIVRNQELVSVCNRVVAGSCGAVTGMLIFLRGRCGISGLVSINAFKKATPDLSL